jgi:hypothetical protein
VKYCVTIPFYHARGGEVKGEIPFSKRVKIYCQSKTLPGRVVREESKKGKIMVKKWASTLFLKKYGHDFENIFFGEFTLNSALFSDQLEVFGKKFSYRLT